MYSFFTGNLAHELYSSSRFGQVLVKLVSLINAQTFKFAVLIQFRLSDAGSEGKRLLNKSESKHLMSFLD